MLFSVIERLEETRENGFNKYIEQPMAYQVPQPQTDNWTEALPQYLLNPSETGLSPPKQNHHSNR